MLLSKPKESYKALRKSYNLSMQTYYCGILGHEFTEMPSIQAVKLLYYASPNLDLFTAFTRTNPTTGSCQSTKADINQYDWSPHYNVPLFRYTTIQQRPLTNQLLRRSPRGTGWSPSLPSTGPEAQHKKDSTI